MEVLDSIGKRYGQLPSKVLGERNPFVGLAIDLWAHNWGVQREAHQVNQLKRKGRGR
jgi:hypothetical protein